MTVSAKKSARYRSKDVEGYRERKRAYTTTPEQRAKRTEYMRGWREKNRARHNEIARQTYHRHRERIQAWQREHQFVLYGLTRESFQAMLESQGGVCAICGEFRTSKRMRLMHIDHDHDTGMVRGILCTRCNGALGWFEKYSAQIDHYLEE